MCVRTLKHFFVSLKRFFVSLKRSSFHSDKFLSDFSKYGLKRIRWGLGAEEYAFYGHQC